MRCFKIQLALELGCLPSELNNRVSRHELAELIAFKEYQFELKHPDAAKKQAAKKPLSVAQATAFLHDLGCKKK